VSSPSIIVIVGAGFPVLGSSIWRIRKDVNLRAFSHGSPMVAEPLARLTKAAGLPTKVYAAIAAPPIPVRRIDRTAWRRNAVSEMIPRRRIVSARSVPELLRLGIQ
jgi:hypothetical protein